MLNSKTKLATAVLLVLNLTACVDDGENGVNGVDGQDGASGIDGVSTFVTRADVVKTNANIAYAVYSDSLLLAHELKSSLQTLLGNPSIEHFTQAKQAWLAAREPYGQSEVYRFRLGPIDTLKSDNTFGVEGEGPEGRINAWPLGEAMIDYVAPVVDGNANPEALENALSDNIIADSETYPQINKQTLLSLFEHSGDERNVTTGYHAIEFLLWGQDLNQDGSGTGERDNSGGQRSVTDFHTADNGYANSCTSGVVTQDDSICQRRGDYLLATIEILIDDLTAVTNSWAPSVGAHYNSFVAGGDVSLAKILEGMGRLSFGELAGERMKVALNSNSQEDEHSCFSDNTHRDIYLNAKGVQNSYLGSYTRVNGELIAGAAIHDLLVVENAHQLANQLRGALEATQANANVIDSKAKTGQPFDQLLQEGIDQPNISAMIDSLVDQTDLIEQAIQALNVTTSDLRQDTEEL